MEPEATLAAGDPPTATAATAGGSRKRPRCACAANVVLVEELSRLRARVRDPTSHLSANYTRAIASVMRHEAPIRDGRQAKAELRNVGSYLANQIHAVLQRKGLLQTTMATSVSVDVASKEYAPTYRKQPWFVILGLSDERATSESGAVAVNTLLLRMQRSGYDGNAGKLRACLASLCGTHEVVRKTAAGLLYLTAKGRRSVELCPGRATRAPPSADAGSSSQELAPAPAPPSEQETDRRGQQLVPTATGSTGAPAVATSLSPTSRPAADAGVVCIDLSDTEENDDRQDDADSFEFEPDAEPPIVSTATSPEAPPESLGGVILPSDTWELVLVLDHREILSRQNRDVLERKLLERNVTCEVRALNVGDMQWVARRFRGEAVDEFMLNAIVERKEVRDLSGSIIDRRYTEQKTRLRASGVTHVIYLAEGSLHQQTAVRVGGLRTALCRTQVQDQFFVQVCQNADETVAFLAAVHARLLAKFPRARCRNPPLEHLPRPSLCRLPTQATATPREFADAFCRPVQSFATFNALFRKKTSFSVREVYQMMLTQAPAMSAAKALGVAAKHPTLRQLRDALAAQPAVTHRDERVENVRCGESQRRLGIKARDSLAYLLTADEYSDSDAALGRE